MENPLTSILERFSLIARPEILRDHLPSSCIASTWITIQVMQQLGFSARPLEVRLSVGNAAYRRLRDQLGPPRTQAQLAEWSREHGACVVGVGFDDGSVGIGGHLNQSTQDWHTLIRLQTQPSWGRRSPCVPMFCGSI